MITIRPIIKTIIGLPLTMSPCAAKNSQDFFATTKPIIMKQELKQDVFLKTANKASSNVSTNLPIKSGTQINSKTALSAEELDTAIEDLIKPMNKRSKRNALRGKGKVLIEAGEKYGVNPVTILSIAMTESSRGISSAALNKNNIGGLTGRKGLIRYKSVDECIFAMAKLLQKHTQNGRTTIQALGLSGKYCAKSVGKNWIKHNNFYIKQIEAHKISK